MAANLRREFVPAGERGDAKPSNAGKTIIGVLYIILREMSTRKTGEFCLGKSAGAPHVWEKGTGEGGRRIIRKGL